VSVPPEIARFLNCENINFVVENGMVAIKNALEDKGRINYED
jgi:hypothetical protein